ncbi:MAG: TerB family tellurite resistance protein [Myxococcales bacterium]|nr:TerB family tellurite resistance protein [Myxococcales bacterium]
MSQEAVVVHVDSAQPFERTADAADATSVSSAAVEQSLQRQMPTVGPKPIGIVSAIFVFALGLVLVPPWLALVAALVVAYVFVTKEPALRRRMRRTVIEFAFDGGPRSSLVREAHARLLSALERSAMQWLRVEDASAEARWEPAIRVGITVSPEQNVLVSDRADVALLPTGLLIVRGFDVRFALWSDVRASASRAFIGPLDRAPPDNKHVERRYLHQRLDGGADRRYKHNPELTFCYADELVLRTRSEVEVRIRSSRTGAAAEALAAIECMQRPGAMETSKPASAPTPKAFPTHAPNAATGQPESDALEQVLRGMQPPAPPVDPARCSERELRAMVDLLRFVALADRRFTSDEETQIILQVSRVANVSLDRAATLVVAASDDRKVDIDATLTVVRAMTVTQRAALLEAARTLASIDGRATPKERERLALIEGALARG